MPSVNRAGYVYIELLVSFSLTVFLFASLLTIEGEMVKEGNASAEKRVLQREASAIHQLLLHEVKKGYDFRRLGNDLLFDIGGERTVRLQCRQSQLTRTVSDFGGPFNGSLVIGRYVASCQFTPDEDGGGVALKMTLIHKGATLECETYWRSRIEQVGLVP